MEITSRFKQIPVYIKQRFRLFQNEKNWKNFISSTIITIIICSVVGDDTFLKYSDTRNGAFALICACIWIGIFNSIQSICKERDIIKREHRSGMHISSYIISHMVYEMFLSVVESFIVTIILYIRCANNIPVQGVLFPAFIELLITFFFIIYSSSVLGLMVSSIVKTPNSAMTVMPFVLILQLVMSGMIFPLKDFTETISNLMIAKWALRAICITANVNSMFLHNPNLESDYKYTIQNLIQQWTILLVFIVIYAIISIICLKFIDKDKR